MTASSLDIDWAREELRTALPEGKRWILLQFEGAVEDRARTPVPPPSASLPAPEETDGWEVEALRTAIRWITDGHCDDGEVHHTFPYEERAWCVVGGKTHAVVDVDDRNAPQNSLIYSTAPEPAPEVEETAEYPDCARCGHGALIWHDDDSGICVCGCQKYQRPEETAEAVERTLRDEVRLILEGVGMILDRLPPAARPSPLREDTPASEAHRSAVQQANDLTRDLCDSNHEMPSASETAEVCDWLFADGPCGEPADAECHWYSDDHDHRPSARCHPFLARQDTPASPEEVPTRTAILDYLCRVDGWYEEHHDDTVDLLEAHERAISRAAEERAMAAYAEGHDMHCAAEARVQELEAALETVVTQLDRVPRSSGPALLVARRALAGRQTEPQQGGE